MKLAKQFISILILFSIFSCASKPKAMDQSLVPSLVKITGKYQRINRVENLPLVITDYFNKPIFCAGIVNPESEFNSSCGTRLVSAGNAGDIWFIEFLTGGTGVSQTFLAFRLKDNVISSLGSVYQGRVVQLSIEELANRLPPKASCSLGKENWLQHIYETGFGLCPST